MPDSIECPNCNRIFDSRRALGIHHSAVHGEKLVEYEKRTRDGVDCPKCDLSFESEKGMKIHHSKEHGESIAGVETECTNCGQVIRKPPHKMEDLERPFCSPKCQHKWRTKNFEGKQNPAWKGGLEIVECDWCGNKFEELSAKLEYYDRHFCGHDCMSSWQAENWENENAPNWKGGKEIECKTCGKPTYVYPSRQERHEIHFCSWDCHVKGYRGSNHAKWKEGNEYNYTGSWTKVRQSALERDNRQCQRCGMEQSTHMEEYNQELHVHHIQPVRTFEEPEEAHELDNLITLCSGCHRTLEGLPIDVS